MDHFPKSVLIPKAVTGAEGFLSTHPSLDGRGIVVAVLDTGIDPSASGLQITSNGLPKVIDFIDASGSGDVDVSSVRTTDSPTDRQIENLHGHILKIPDEWCNPSGIWHVGVKNEYEFVPSLVKTCAQEEFTSKVWNPAESALQAKAARELERFNSQHKNSKLPLDEMLEKGNLEAKVDILERISSKGIVPGAVFDCIVFHDGENWSAILDSSHGEKLENCEVLKPFKVTRQTMKFGDMTLSVNIYDDGNTLSIVTAGDAHGTHVASIAAAYVPDCPEMNGVAPGAQLVSIKIGDSRLGMMETARSVIRACSMAVSMGVDMINFSYGEASHWTRKGAVLDIITDVCYKHKIVFVSSAGNNGPALSTVGCPGGNTPGLIGVGAFVSPEMMSADYSMTGSKPGLPYTWCSRGPTTDGDLGVCITAPGGAIASVPTWTLKKNKLMHGTSMSSPNACGCIALLLCALRSKGFPYSPAFIKKIVENTAAPLGKHDPFSIGHGIIQVDKAYDAAMKGFPSHLVDLQVSVSGSKGRGIYLREPHEVGVLCKASVTVEPKFPVDTGTQEKIEFELHLALISTESWVVPPKHLALWNGARQFKVEVDPRNLPSGVHFAQVLAYKPGDDRGPLFRIPVTVVIPEELTSNMRDAFIVPQLTLEKGSVKRLFFHVPKGATWAVLQLSNVQCESGARIAIHTVQLLPEKSFRVCENNEVLTLQHGGHAQLVLDVAGGYTMELCLTTYWSELKGVSLCLRLCFHGILPSTPTLVFNAAHMWTSMKVATLQDEEMSPELKLTHRIVYKRPSSHKIFPLGSRDVLPNGTLLFELLLTYDFRVNHTTEVRPDFPLLSDLLYENPYSGQMWMVFNVHKQYMFAGDAYSAHYATKLDKGSYTLRMQVCHTNQQELKKLTEMPLCLHLKLSSSLSMEVVGTRYEIMSGIGLTTKTLRPGEEITFYLRSMPDVKLAKIGAQQGDTITGRFTLCKQEKMKKKNPFKLNYFVGSMLNKVSSEERKESLYSDSLKDFKINWMRRGVLHSEDLQEEYGDDVKFLLARLTLLSEDDSASYESAAALASKVYSKIDRDDVLRHMGMRKDLCAESNQEWEEKRRQLAECLSLEGKILMQKQASSGHLTDIYMDLHKFLDKNDDMLRTFKLKFAEARGHFAIVLKLVEEEINLKGASRPLDEKLITCYRKLDFEHFATLQEQWLLRKYPPNILKF